MTVGTEVLSALLAAGRFDDILTFLQTGAAGLDPAAGKLPVVPRKPAESGFLLQIQPGGVMAGRFSTAEAAVVERWINSL